MSLKGILGTAATVAGNAFGGPIGGAIAGSIAGSVLGSDGAKGAQQAQQSATNDATALNREIYYDQKATNADLLADTNLARNRLIELLGINGTPGINTQFSFDANSLYNDPGYVFRRDQGQQAIERSAAARGGLNSGAALKALTRYGQDYASNEYGTAYNRAQNTFQGNLANILNPLQSLAGGAQSAINSQNAASANYANANSGLISAQGNANAAAQIAGANSMGNSLSGVGNAFGQNQLLTQLLGGSKSGGSTSSWLSAANNSSDPLGSFIQLNNGWGTFGEA